MAVKDTKALIINPISFCEENGIQISEEQADEIQKQLNLIQPNSEDHALTLLILLS